MNILTTVGRSLSATSEGLLMAIKKLNDGRYEVDIRPNGQDGKRLRRIFDRKVEAVTFEKYAIVNAKKFSGDIQLAGKVKLKELLDKWWLYHGQTLKNGIIEKRHLLKTVKALGNPTMNQLDKHALLEHRSSRLIGGISPSTINRDMYRLSGMLTALEKLELFKSTNPLKGLPPLKEKEPELTFLSEQEIPQLLNSVSGDYRLIALLCLSTGARWSEAESLHSEQVQHGRVTFLQTKNGKKRVIPISDELVRQIKTKNSGKLFKVDYNTFRETLKRVKPDLPKGQATHVLRHTFASHFVMNGGNIVALKEILGHASINQTMAYAHLAPDYLQLAIKLNPLNGMKI
ncbi:integrase [Providencia alcalifaciens]|nr:integrase [Providencia alcalifaciens]